MASPLLAGLTRERESRAWGASRASTCVVADAKRRLPVLKADGSKNEDDNRPPWHWVGFGTLLVFGAWLPLAYAASAIETRLLARFAQATSQDAVASALREASPHDAARLRFQVLILLTMPLALGAFAGGFIVGRWSKDAGVREAALAGLAAALVACVLSWADAGISVAPLAGVAIAVPMAALGGWSGAQRRSTAGVTA
jgi:hypothetical protein